MKKVAIILVAFLMLTVASVKAGIHENTVLYEAHQLALAGATDDAVTEYQRYLFFNPDSPAVAIYLSIAGMYRDQGRFADAQDALQSALTLAETDTLRDAIRIEYSLLEMAQGRYSSAQMELLRIDSFSKNAAVRLGADRFLCISYILAGNLSEAMKISSSGSAVSGDPFLRQIDSLLKNGPRYSRKSPLAAKIMSAILPGLGQVYANDLRGGLNALVISVLTGFMTVHSIFYGYYQEAIFTDATIFWRYYSGNLWHASRAAEKDNEKRDRLLFNLVVDKILPGTYLK